MKRHQALALLNANKNLLREKFGIVKLALFGSTARDTAVEGSDVDILISFEGKANAKRYFEALFYLEDLLDCPVDLVTEQALRPELKPYVEAETIYV